MEKKHNPTQRDRLQALARFAGAFAAPGPVFGVWHQASKIAEGVFEFPYFELSPEASKFVKAAYEFGWVQPIDWSGWRETDEGKRLLTSPEQVATATEEQLARLLTAFIRGDRFCEGTLGAAFKAGFLTAIAQRAEVLLQELSKAWVGDLTPERSGFFSGQESSDEADRE